MTPAAFVATREPIDLITAATHAVGSYLYSDGCLEALELEVDRPELREFDNAALAALSELATFGCPQIHRGTLTELRQPTIHNRDPLSALPGGAFWTSTPLTGEEDSWTVSGENLRRQSPRWEIHFDPTALRVARIDSARDWIDLIESNPIPAGRCKYPDWPSTAASWDAVHLSPAGLLLAHPAISTTPFSTTNGTGYAHSRAGLHASVADWSAVSTAWLRRPTSMELRSASTG